MVGKKMIQEYSFGKIVINDKIYSKDLYLFNDKVFENWRRKNGHNVQIEDLEEILRLKPKKIIFGTGAFGLMKVSKKVKELLDSNNIEYVSKKTAKAYEIYNNLDDKRYVVAAFHLTC